MSEVEGTAVGAEASPAEQKYTRNNPYFSTVVTNYLLSGEGSEKETRHLAFALEEGMMEASRFPGIAIHQLQHKLLIDQVHALATQRGSSALRRNAEPLNFLAASHIKHIGYADLHYGIWLNASSSQRTDTACTNKIDI